MTGAALVLSVVDTCTGESHLVPVETAALHRHSGRYPALCGVDVPAASLTTPPARHCPDCATRARGKGRGKDLQQQPIRPRRLRIPRFRKKGRHQKRDGRSRGFGT